MPAINYAQKLFEANAVAATDWGAIEGASHSEVVAGASLKRGLRLEVGLSALADLDIGLAKFIAARVTGKANAAAQVTVQVQLPLNLFEEAGASIRLQAVAEAAAGVQATIGISVGDFIELAYEVFPVDGLGLKLFLLFLEEIELTAGVYAKVAFTAQAQAYGAIVGTLRHDATRGLRPGFNFVAGAGLGLGGGAGVRKVVRAGFRDFPRFYVRAVDLAVDAVFDETVRKIGPVAGSEVLGALDAARPPLKMAFRLAYELGEHLATRNPAHSPAGAAELAARATSVVFEECQRHLLRAFFESSVQELRKLLKPRLRGLDAAARARVKPLRDAVIARLRGRPSDLFDLGTRTTQDFWLGFAADAAALASEAFAGVRMPAQVTTALASAWCASQLLLVATKRASRAEASFSVVGLPSNAVQAPFVGAALGDPPLMVSELFVSALGVQRPADGWKLEHAVAFLATGPALVLLENASPRMRPFLDAFKDLFGATSSLVAKGLLSHLGAFAPSSGAAPSARHSLELLAGVLRRLMVDVIEGQALPLARAALKDSPDALLYLNDVLAPGAHFSLETCVDLVLEWEAGRVSREVATEAFSSVLMKLLGRTLVVTFDLFQDHVQKGAQRMFEQVAHDAGTSGLGNTVAQLTGWGRADATEKAQEVLQLLGRTLRPYTPAERREIRGLWFSVLDPLPASAGKGFLAELAQDHFVPNAEAAIRLAQRTYELVSERFVAFALGSLELMGEAFLDLLEEALETASKAMLSWLQEAGRALAEAERAMAEWGLQALDAADEAAEAADAALGDLADALAAIGASGRKNVFGARFADSVVEKVSDLLEAHPLYRVVPRDLRSQAKNTAKSVARGLTQGPVNRVFEAVAGLAGDVGQWLNDVRSIDPSTGLLSGIEELLMDRIESGVRQTFGGEDPGFEVGFAFEYTAPELRVGFDGVRIVTRTHRIDFSLGRVEIPLSRVVAIARDVVIATSGFEAAMARSAGHWRRWLEKELEAKAKRDEVDHLSSRVQDLRKDQDALVGAPSALYVTSPTQGGVYRDLIPVRIILEDASSAFVDFQRGPARFFAHLNGVSLPSSFFRTTVSGAQPSASGSASPEGIPGARRLDIDGLIAFQGPGSAARLNVAHLKTTVTGGDLRVAFKPSTRLRGVAPSALPAQMQEGVRANRMMKPGSKQSPKDWRQLVTDSSGAHAVLEGLLEPANGMEGPNVLTVAVIGPDGARVTQSTTFLIEAPPAEPPGSVNAPPPRRSLIDRARLQPMPAKAALTVAERAAMAKNMRAGVAAVLKGRDPTSSLAAASPMLKARLASGVVAAPGNRVPRPVRPRRPLG